MKKPRKFWDCRKILLTLTVIAVGVFGIIGLFPKFTYAQAAENHGSITLTYRGISKNFNLARYNGTKSSIFTHQEFSDNFQTGSYQQKLKTMDIIASQKWPAEMAFRYCYGGLCEDIERFLTDKVDAAPVDARVGFKPDRPPMFSVIRERAGLQADRETLYADLLRSYLASPSVSVRIKTRPVEAEIKSADLQKKLKDLTTLRSRFSTSVAGSTDERRHNVILALKKFNGITIMPDETVSFNKTVGLRSEARGFRTAKIIVRGKFEDGIGGGVCQSSTTLYNAALLADMTILEANNHTLAPSYVPPSFDAMVNATWSDLIFRNESENPVYIHTYYRDGKVFAEFYGMAMPYEIVRRSVTLETISHGGSEHIFDTDGKYSEFVKHIGETHIVQTPKNGLKSKGYLRYYKDGMFIKEKEIRADTYKPLKGLVVEGTKKKPEPPPEQTLEPIPAPFWNFTRMFN
jgi:vancomycin resistance protein YoaR